jgi:hypothetical protein
MEEKKMEVMLAAVGLVATIDAICARTIQTPFNLFSKAEQVAYQRLESAVRRFCDEVEK